VENVDDPYSPEDALLLSVPYNTPTSSEEFEDSEMSDGSSGSVYSSDYNDDGIIRLKPFYRDTSTECSSSASDIWDGDELDELSEEDCGPIHGILPSPTLSPLIIPLPPIKLSYPPIYNKDMEDKLTQLFTQVYNILQDDFNLERCKQCYATHSKVPSSISRILNSESSDTIIEALEPPPITVFTIPAETSLQLGREEQLCNEHFNVLKLARVTVEEGIQQLMNEIVTPKWISEITKRPYNDSIRKYFAFQCPWFQFDDEEAEYPDAMVFGNLFSSSEPLGVICTELERLFLTHCYILLGDTEYNLLSETISDLLCTRVSKGSLVTYLVETGHLEPKQEEID
jgi:hypothetical protein